MIKISDALLDAYCDILTRPLGENKIDKMEAIIEDMKRDNPALLGTIISTIKQAVAEIKEDDLKDEDLSNYVTINMMWIASQVYNVIAQQMIVNELNV